MHLATFVQTYGAWVYALLFLIIFVETGVVVMPFLPGDSLLFVVGALCGVGLMNLPLVMALLIAAAVLGNQTNYTIGRYFGPKVFQWENSRFFNKERVRPGARVLREVRRHHDRASRASCRSCAPSRRSSPASPQMTRRKFTFYDVTGGALWVGSLTLAGYLFGNIPWVKDQPRQDHLGSDLAARSAGAVRRLAREAQARAGSSGRGCRVNEPQRRTRAATPMRTARPRRSLRRAPCPSG